MSVPQQAKAVVVDFRAFLAKTNAVGAAIALATGLATTAYVKEIVATVIQPLIDQIPGGAPGFKLWVFRVGDLIGATITFVATMWVIYLFGKVLIREQKKEERKEEAAKG